MAANGLNGPSPKRRKTVTANEIANANSTAQLFAGRQHRWMAGYVPPEANEQVQQQQTGAMSRSMSDIDVQRSHANAHAAGASDAASVNVQQGHGRESLSSISSFPAGCETFRPSFAASDLVQYDAPAVATTQQNNNSDFTPPNSNIQSQAMPTPGLPSPALSDGIMPSPAMSANAFQAPAPPSTTPQPRRGRPPGRQPSINILPPNTATLRTPSAGFAVQQRVVPSQSQQQFVAHPMQPNVSVYAPQAPQPQQFVGFQSKTLRPDVLRRKLDHFQSLQQQKNLLNPIDQGRLMLLREAIDKGDWFYICLSQIHAVSSTRNALPQSVTSSVEPKAFRYVDILLSNNGGISPQVLQTLIDFPVSLLSFYSSSDQDEYKKLLDSVIRFLHYLPAQWDQFVADCKTRESPPLVEELVRRFWLTSPVLQTTVFRAIARMIWDSHPTASTSEGIEALERLHRQNQEATHKNFWRDERQIANGHEAFRQALRLWKMHQQNLMQHNARQLNLPDAQRIRPPRFELPKDIIRVFQVPQFAQSGLVFQQQSVQPSQSGVGVRVVSGPNNGQPAARPIPHYPASQQASPAQNGVRVPSMPVPQPYRVIVPIAAQTREPSPRLVFPHERDQPRPQPTQPDPNRSALHQAHLRSPILATSGLANENPRLYRSVVSFAMGPNKLDKDKPMDYMDFDVSAEALLKIPPTHPPDKPGERVYRHLDLTSQTYRLRCAAVPKGGFPNEKRWLEADSIWPDNLFMSLNGHALEPRRKLHHGRYLPIDLTTFIQQGQNVLTVCHLRTSMDQRPFEYALAVEVVGVTQHEDIFANLKHLSASDSLAAIKKSLSGEGDDDDDVAVTSSTTIINLLDPYYGDRIVTLPVRGSECLHRNCFDLEIFLSTCRREQPGWPTYVDVWRCPICRGDVRPQTLLVDGFLVEVRKELERKGMLTTRAIVVEGDGRWTAKEEEKSGVRSESLERDERVDSIMGSGRGKGSSMPPKKAPEIVVLDDD